MTLQERDKILSLLEVYSEFLHREHYLDTDFYNEPPSPIDEFMKLLEYNPGYDSLREKLGLPKK